MGHVGWLRLRALLGLAMLPSLAIACPEPGYGACSWGMASAVLGDQVFIFGGLGVNVSVQKCQAD